MQLAATPTRRMLAVFGVLALTAGVVTVLSAPRPAQAHGALQAPASRTYACYTDGIVGSGEIVPENPACQAAVAAGGTQPLYDWYGVLRSDGGGRTRGYIPDGQLCSGGNPKYAAYDAPRADWPATPVRADGTYDFSYGAWVPHPGGIRLYITKDGYDPTKPLTWDDLEAQPFLTADPQPPVSDGAYRFSGQLPHRSGRHVIYSVWSRTDSQETFYGCSDVDFSGPGGPTPTPTPTPTGPTPTPSTSPTAPPAVACRASLHTDNSWSGGFQATLTITNTGTTTMTNWYASWTFPTGVRLDQVWNGTPMQSGTTAMIHAASWNRVLAPGASTTAGLLGSGTTAPTFSDVTCG
ncbi:lytic polysaccharide monooxygenase [Micromonospora sp. WMMA2032]|uniref:lytic polysaccharide monooxygenase n=1 Tax=Micromonospora sp. WMMA2032 TaxID=2039870 RepID=UPI00156253A1|nr:lytic polysaccharide monooxygenase [Micromonospora sp. WMMA2032]